MVEMDAMLPPRCLHSPPHKNISRKGKTQHVSGIVFFYNEITILLLITVYIHSCCIAVLVPEIAAEKMAALKVEALIFQQ